MSTYRLPPIVIRRREHRYMRRKLLEIEPGPLLDIVPIHSDEIVTFAAREKWKKTRRVKVGRRKENLFVHQHRKGRKISETWGD